MKYRVYGRSIIEWNVIVDADYKADAIEEAEEIAEEDIEAISTGDTDIEGVELAYDCKIDEVEELE